MPRNVRLYLTDIQTSIAALQEFTTGKTFENLETDRMLRSAMRGEFMLIGEAISQMLHHFPETEQRIESARRIVDLRNLLVHGYNEVDDRILWSILVEFIPRLQRQADDGSRALALRQSKRVFQAD